MPLTNKQRNDANAAFDSAFNQVSSAQSNYKSTRPLYAQVLPGNQKPSYQADALPVTLPAGYAVHQYVGPRGIGWILVGKVTHDTTYVKVRTFGPDTYLDQDWTV